jgi:magnesium-transporting ATPase (P-type)
MRIPADCVLLEGTDVAVDESGLTGEPEQVDK